MDEQGVGPCGHAAKEKGVLVKLFASCLSNEIPTKLVFSTHCARNDKNLGTMAYMTGFRSTKKLHEGQHTSGLDFTQVKCKNTIDKPCTMAPWSTWQQWSTSKSILVVTGKDKGRPVWCYLKVKDDENTICTFKEKTQGDNAGKLSANVEDYGEVLRKGWGEYPPNEVEEWIEKNYFTDYYYKPYSKR